MTDADNQEQTSQQNTQNSDGTRVEAELAKVQAQLEAMNQLYAEQSKAIASLATKPQRQEVEISDDDVYDPKALSAKVLKKTDEVISQHLARERELNATIYNLTQEYPEISSNASMRKAVIDAHNAIPDSLKGTAAGYEMAVLKVTSKEGLVPKSKRKDVQVDADISAGGGSSRSESRPKGKKAVTEKMIALAQLLGRDTNDPKVMKGLEEAANRDSYGRYR